MNLKQMEKFIEEQISMPVWFVSQCGLESIVLTSCEMKVCDINFHYYCCINNPRSLNGIVLTFSPHLRRNGASPLYCKCYCYYFQLYQNNFDYYMLRFMVSHFAYITLLNSVNRKQTRHVNFNF